MGGVRSSFGGGSLRFCRCGKGSSPGEAAAGLMGGDSGGGRNREEMRRKKKRKSRWGGGEGGRQSLPPPPGGAAVGGALLEQQWRVGGLGLAPLAHSFVSQQPVCPREALPRAGCVCYLSAPPAGGGGVPVAPSSPQ